ncbi:MAG: patatin-like phospholipase family protein, partial [Calditrichia bacterium]
RRYPRVGLALGGGGVRGMAHMGVLSVLKQEKIPVDAMAGSSMGAIIAAAYTLNPEYGREKITDLLRELDESIPSHLKEPADKPESFLHKLKQFINVERFILDTISGWSVLPEDIAPPALQKITLDKNIEEADIPIAVVSVDLLSGEKVVFREGPATIALQGSSAIPGFLPPVEYRDMVLVDGAIVDVVPADVVRQMDVDIVIAVDVDQSGPRSEIRNGLDAFLRAVELCAQHNKRHYLKDADIVIKPDFGETIVTFDVSKAEHCIETGVRAAMKALPEIKKLLERKT